VNRRDFLRAGVLAGVGTLGAPMLNLGRFRLFADDRIEHSGRAIDLVARATVIDMLGLLTLDWPKLDLWQRDPRRFAAADFRRFQGSGISVFHPAVDTDDLDPAAAAERWMTGWNHLLGGRPDCFLRIDAAADLTRAKESRRIGIVLGFQNSDHFQKIEDVARFHQEGQRVSQLTYNEKNRLGCGCKVAVDGGLSPYGAEIIRAMNQVGMAVDVSHCSERTSLDACAVSERPVLITHANCRALVAQPRCKSDTVIRALAARGGVMGITTVPAFVRRARTVTFEDVLDHFDHVARVAGVEHVGLGSDTDLDAVDPRTGRVRPMYAVAGLDHPRRVFDLAEGLLRRGYGEPDVELVLGGNFARVLAQIWDVPPSPPVEAALPSSPSAAAGLH
jgi:membrane dipeptidase